MKLDPRRVEGLLRQPDPKLRALLVYGPDTGLVRERAELLVRTVVPDPTDPFRVVVMTGRTLASDPARLLDEIDALAFGGGRRVIRIRSAGDEIALLLADAVANAKGDALVVVDADDLGPRSKLRTLFETSANAGAIPCYADEEGQVADLIRRRLRQDGIAIAADALDFLVARLGNDRMVTRSEIDKLALYAGNGGRLELADAIACAGNSADLSLDDIAFAVGDGDSRRALHGLDRAYAEGNSPVAILRGVARHFQRLHLAASMVAGGQRPDQAVGALRPPVFFKLKPPFLAQLRKWPTDRLGTALARLTETEIACKTTGMPDEALCARTLMEIAAAARRL